jgi:hypothetical protein
MSVGTSVVGRVHLFRRYAIGASPSGLPCHLSPPLAVMSPGQWQSVGRVPLLNPLPTIRCGRGRDLPGTSLPRSRRSKLGYAPLPYCVVGPGRGQCSIHAATCHPQEQGGAWLHELKVARLHELPECELQLTSHVHAGDSASSHVPVHDPMLLEAELGLLRIWASNRSSIQYWSQWDSKLGWSQPTRSSWPATRASPRIQTLQLFSCLPRY